MKGIETLKLQDEEIAMANYLLKIANPFQLGAFGKVIQDLSVGLGSNKESDQNVIVKVIPESIWNSQIKVQAGLHKKHTHPHLIEFYSHLIQQNNAYLFFESFSEITLRNIIQTKGGKLAEDKIQIIASQIGETLQFLSNKNLGHGDLHPESFIMKELENNRFIVKLSDLGILKIIKESIGEPNLSNIYSPSETITHSNVSKADAWSVGVILLELFLGKLPQNKEEIISELNSNTNSMSPIFEDFLRNLLQKDPKKRMSWNNFLHHPFIIQEYQQPVKMVSQEEVKSLIVNMENPKIEEHEYVFSIPFKKTNDILHYNIQKKIPQILLMPPSFKMPYNRWNCVSIGNHIYICGGETEQKQFLKLLVQYDIISNAVFPKKDMNFEKSGTALIAIKNTIFSIGGNNPSGPTNTVEKYGTIKDLWSISSPLNEKKAGSSLANFNSQFLFVFGGSCGSHKSGFIEKLNLQNEGEGWKIIKTTKLSFEPRSSCASIQISSSEILIFGGRDNNDHDLSESLIFNAENNTLRKTKHSLKQKNFFFPRQASYSNSHVYIFGGKNDFYKLHVFSLNNEKWEIREIGEFKSLNYS